MSEQLEQLARETADKIVHPALCMRDTISPIILSALTTATADLRKTIEQLKLNSPKCAACAEALWCGGVTSANEHTCHGDLRREVELIGAQRDAAMATRTHVTNDFNRLSAENDQLRPDKERLDWLFAHSYELYWGFNGRSGTEPDTREKIDAARAAALKPA